MRSIAAVFAVALAAAPLHAAPDASSVADTLREQASPPGGLYDMDYGELRTIAEDAEDTEAQALIGRMEALRRDLLEHRDSPYLDAPTLRGLRIRLKQVARDLALAAPGEFAASYLRDLPPSTAFGDPAMDREPAAGGDKPVESAELDARFDRSAARAGLSARAPAAAAGAAVGSLGLRTAAPATRAKIKIDRGVPEREAAPAGGGPSGLEPTTIALGAAVVAAASLIGFMTMGGGPEAEDWSQGASSQAQSTSSRGLRPRNVRRDRKKPRSSA